MAKIVKTLTVSWQWSGDKYSLRGFNLAVTPAAKNPKEEVVATAFVETKEIKQTYSYKMGNVTLDKDAQYKIWVQAVYENSDSDWVATGGATVSDDGSATIITKTDREIQDIVNMASDNILTRQEKISLRREWQEIVYEFLEIESTAISQGIPSSNTAFSNFKSKGNALGTYLNGGTAWTISSNNKTSFPLWINDSNLGSNTSINGNTYRETFRVYYEAKVKILEEINKYKVNNVQIGGINLLTGTKDFNAGKGSGTIHSETYKGFSVLYKDFSTATSGISDVCGWNNAIDVKQNTEYTLSFYAKGSGDFRSYFHPDNVASGYSSEGKKTTYVDGMITHTLTSNWKKYWITWKTTASATGLKSVLPMRLLPGGVGYICGVKFEEGNKATDWSPSLEEMENAYTIILTNEAEVIPTNSNRVPTSSTTYFTDIQVYKGTTQRNDYTIGTINSANGITVSKTSSRVNFAVSPNTALAADGGNFIIPITIDSKTFNKTFSWSCSKQGNTGATGATGPAGQNAQHVVVTGEQVFKYADNFSGTPTPATITLTATKINTTATGKWQWLNGSTWTDWSTDASTLNATTLSVSPTNGSLNTGKSIRIRYIVDSVYDEITLVKVSDGTNGTNGANGADAYTVILTNETHTFPTQNNGNIPTALSTTTQVVAYKGASSVTPTIGNLPSVSGLTLSKSGTTVTVQANTGTSLADSGSFNIPVTVDGKSFTKTFSWSKAKQGNTGATGNAGQDAITIVLSNENHTFPCESNGNIPTALSTTCVVTAYKGGTSVTPTIGSITNPTGMTISKNGATLTIQANTGTSLADSGTVNIPITVDGKTFNKTFTWSKAKKGATGATGAAGAGAKTADIIASSQVFKSTDGGLTFSPATIKLTPKLQNVTYSNWQYSVNGGGSWTNVVSGEKGMSIDSSNKALAISKDSSLFTSTVTSVTFRLNTNDSSVYDTITIVKLYDVADLEIGGRNYLQNSNFANGLDKWAVHDLSNGTGTNKSVSTIKGGSWADPSINTLQIKGTNVAGRYGVQSSNMTLVANTTYTISGYCAGHRVRKIQVNVRDKQNSDANIHTVEYNPVDGGNSLSKYYKFETTFTTTSNTLFALNLYAVDLADNGYTWFANIKLEKGNKASDWTPAPEDVATDIDNAKNEAIDSANNTLTTTISNYYTKEETNSQIDVAKEAINLGVSSTYETKTSVESKVSSTLNSAKSYADDKKTEAINAASTDATDKVNSAKNELNTKINNIQIGGTNIIRNSRNPKNLACWDANVTEFKVANSGDIGENVFKLTATTEERYASTMRYRVEPNCQYTFSMDVLMEANVNNIDVFWLSRPKGSTEVFVNINKIISNWNATKVKWVRITTSFTTASNDYEGYIRIDNNGSSSTTGNAIWFTKVKLEKGNKATDWSPAPEDVNSNIDDVKNSLNSFQTTVNTTFKDGIVEEAEAKAISQHLKTLDAEKADIDKEYTAIYSNAYLTGTAKTNLSSAKTSYDSAHTSLKSTINTVIADGKVTASESASVTSTFNTYNAQLGAYKQCVQEALDNISSAKISDIQIGGINLLAGTKDFSSGKGDGAVHSEKYNGFTVLYKDFSTATSGYSDVCAWYSAIDVKQNKEYTLSFYAKGSGNIHSYFFPNNVASGYSSEGKKTNATDGSIIHTLTNNWKRYWIVWKTSSTTTGLKSVLPMRLFPGVTGYICGVKFEEGNKATDWSPAQADVAKDITNAKTEAINTASNDATSKVNSAKDELNAAISNKANSSDVYVKAEVYTKEQTDSAIKVAKDEINLGVSNTYETKINVETKVNGAVAGLKVGGNNLLRNGNFVYDMANWSVHDTNSGGTAKTVMIGGSGSWVPEGKKALVIKGTNTSDRYGVMSSTMKLTPNTKYTISGYCAGHRVNKIQVNVRDLQNNQANIHTINIDPVGGGNTLNKWYRFETTFTTSSNSNFALNLYSVNFANDGYVWFIDVQLQEGTKATAWTPCSEDIDSSINSKANSSDVYKKTETYTKSETDSKINISKEAIELGVKNTYETKTDVETKINAANSSTLNSAKSYADTKKSEAISTASADATDKVNSAKNELNTAIGKKANSADVYTKTEVYTKNETNSQITAAKDAITQSVSNTYETKTEVANKINAIQVGGTNLLPDTKTLKSGVSSASYITSDTYLGFKVMRCTNTSSSHIDAYRFGSPIDVEPNTEYTLSFYAKGSGSFNSYFYPNNVSTGIHSNGSTTNATDGSIRTTVTSDWKRYWITWKTLSNASGLKNGIIGRIAAGADIYICGAKFEKGNKASAWSPAPEDMETTVSTIEQRVSAAEQKITDESITNTVKKNFYTKQETDNQITSKGYQTESQVQQTVNNLQIKFTESGGYNLLKNGKAAVNTKFWASNGGGITRDSDAIYKTCFKTSLPSGIKYNGGDNGGAIRLKNNTHYVYEAMVYSRTAIGGNATIPLHYWCNTTAEAGGQTQCTVVDYSQKVANINTWTKCYVHFVTKPSGEVWFTPFVYTGGSLTGDIWVTELSLSESSVQTPYSPHPNEVYDGIIEMDKNGIKVSTSNGGWTDFTSAGMNVYNKSSQLSLGTRNGGLTYHSEGEYLGFTSASIVKAYNAEGVSISTATDGVYLTLGHSDATDPFGGFSATPYLSIAKENFGDSDSFYRKGVNVHTALNLNTQNINRVGVINFTANNTSSVYESTNAKNLCMYGDNGAALGYYEGSKNVTKLEIIEGSDKSTSDIRSYGHWRFNNWDLTGVGYLEVVNRLKIKGGSSIHFNADATHPSKIWHSTNDNKLKIFGDNGVDIGYREGDTNRAIFQITEGEEGAYRIQSYSHWHFHNWNLDHVGIVHAQRFNVAGTAGSYYITKGTGDGADYNTYGCLFYTHNGLAFTANGGAATVIVQGRSGRIMGKNAYYVNSSKCLKSDIRAVTSENEPMPVNLKQGEVVDETLTMEMIGDFIDTIGIRTYITDFEQEGATQKDVDPQQGHVLNLGYIADDLAHHPVFKYIGEKTPDNLYAINSNGLTTVALAGLQAERKERRKLEQRLQQLEAMLLKGEE